MEDVTFVSDRYRMTINRFGEDGWELLSRSEPLKSMTKARKIAASISRKLKRRIRVLDMERPGFWIEFSNGIYVTSSSIQSKRTESEQSCKDDGYVRIEFDDAVGQLEAFPHFLLHNNHLERVKKLSSAIGNALWYVETDREIRTVDGKRGLWIKAPAHE